MRFCDVKNERKLEMELDVLFIDTVKLYVNMPRYRGFIYQIDADLSTIYKIG